MLNNNSSRINYGTKVSIHVSIGSVPGPPEWLTSWNSEIIIYFFLFYFLFFDLYAVPFLIALRPEVFLAYPLPCLSLVTKKRNDNESLPFPVVIRTKISTRKYKETFLLTFAFFTITFIRKHIKNGRERGEDKVGKRQG